MKYEFSSSICASNRYTLLIVNTSDRVNIQVYHIMYIRDMRISSCTALLNELINN
jgi:hypothetical protein